MKKLKLTICLLLIGLLIVYVINIIPKYDVQQVEKRQQEVLIFIIINHGDFSCQFCLESLLSFYHKIRNLNGFPISVIGVLEYDLEFGDISEEDLIKIIKKQLEGFKIGNRIDFPILLDKNKVFTSFASKGSSVIVMNMKKNNIRSWNIPINENDFDEIIQLIDEQ